MQNSERSKNSTIANVIIIKSLPGDSQGPLVLLRSIAALIYKRASAVIEMYVCMYVCMYALLMYIQRISPYIVPFYCSLCPD